MSRETDRLGLDGEELAADFLSAKGYRVVARRVRTPWGEIDLVAEHATTVIFIEVKTRRSTRFGAPALAVDARRAGRLRNACLHLLSKHPEWRLRQPRIDVVEVLWKSATQADFRHIQDAVGA